MGTNPHLAAAVTAIGTSVPAHKILQADALNSFIDLLGPTSNAARLARRVFPNAGVESRSTCVEELANQSRETELARGTASTKARMRMFHEEAPALAIESCRQALEGAGIEPPEVTHLLALSTTGYSAPGIDIQLVRGLGLDPGVLRMKVGLMGCFAAVNTFRLAQSIVLADPNAIVLVVCVDLCTLHCRIDPSPDSVVAHALFGDGASALIVQNVPEAHPALLHFERSAAHVELGTEDLMTWEIMDDGFRMELSSQVPAAIKGRIKDFIADLSGSEPFPIDSWCVHPGGPSILDSVEVGLSLSSECLTSARGVLREHGNLSSASLMFVLRAELPRLDPGRRGILLGFGPGLTIEALTFRRGTAALN